MRNCIALGIDPGLLRTGWAVVEYKGASEVYYLDSGIIQTDSKEVLHSRLEKIHNEVTAIIDKTKPVIAVLEKVFVNSNPYSSLNLAYCRGALILTLSLKNLHLIELSPSSMKKRITGKGNATKTQVKYMVEQLLRLEPNLSKYSDLYDALALASCVNVGDLVVSNGG